MAANNDEITEKVGNAERKRILQQTKITASQYIAADTMAEKLDLIAALAILSIAGTMSNRESSALLQLARRVKASGGDGDLG